MFTSTWRKGTQWFLAGSLAAISLTGYAASEYRVAMQAGSGHYLSAVNNGGGDVNASGGALDLWESFTLIDTNGGKLEHGDPVHIWTSAARYFHAEHAGGANLTATAPHALSWETFHIEVEW